MVNKEQIVLLNDELKKILQAEIHAGNTVAETAIGGFSKAEPRHLFVFLEKPFLTPIQKDIKGITYTEINDVHYWKAEYTDKKNYQTLACKFDRLSFGAFEYKNTG